MTVTQEQLERARKDEQAADQREFYDETKARAVRADAEDTIEQAGDWLDEIDSILEENAEEFVASYVQKGGE